MNAPPTHDPSAYQPPKSKKTPLLLVLLLVGGLCLCLAVIPALLFPVFTQARDMAKTTLAGTNAKECAQALQIYSFDNNDLFPPADRWMDATKPLTHGDIYRSPAVAGEGQYGFAMRKEFSGQSLPKIQEPEKEPLVFDSTVTAWNATAGLETLPKPGRYRVRGGLGNIIAYADGRVKRVRDTDDPKNPSAQPASD